MPPKDNFCIAIYLQPPLLFLVLQPAVLSISLVPRVESIT